MSWSWVNTKYSIHRVLHHPIIDFLWLSVIVSSLGGPGYTQLCTYPWSWVWPMYRVSAPVHALLLIYCLHIAHLQVHLQARSIMASKCMTKLAESQPPRSHDQRPSNSFDYNLKVHLSVYSISGCKWITKVALSWPPSTSHSSLNSGFQVDL